MKRIAVLLLAVMMCSMVYAEDYTANDVVNNPALLSQNPDLWNKPDIMKSFFDRATPSDVQEQIRSNLEQAKTYFSDSSHLYGNGGEAFLQEISGSTFVLDEVSAGTLQWDESSGTLSNFGGSESGDKQMLELNSLQRGDSVTALTDGGFRVTKNGRSTSYDVPGGSLSFDNTGAVSLPVVKFGDEVFAVQDSYNIQSLSIERYGDQYTISTFKRKDGKIVDAGYLILMRRFPGDNSETKLTLYGTVGLEEKNGVVTRIKVFENAGRTDESQNSYVGLYNAYIKAVQKEALIYFRESDFQESELATSVLMKYDKSDGNMEIVKTAGPDDGKVKISRKIMNSYNTVFVRSGRLETPPATAASVVAATGQTASTTTSVNLEEIIKKRWVMEIANQGHGTYCAGTVERMTDFIIMETLGIESLTEANALRTDMGVKGETWDLRDNIVNAEGTSIAVDECNRNIDCVLEKLPMNTPIIAGIYYDASRSNKDGRPYTHVGYLWNDNGQVKLCHDWGSSTGCVDAKEFFAKHKNTYVKEFLIPKYQADMLCCSTLLTMCC